MEVVRTIESLIENVQAKLAPRVLVSVDGFMGAGKSRTALHLAERLRGTVLHLDVFAARNSDDSYPDKIDKVRLKAKLDATQEKASPVIVESICVLAVLGDIGITPRLRVYVKRISRVGVWHDGFHLEDFESQGPSMSEEEGLRRDEMVYHVTTRPHETADIVFERCEDQDA